MVRDVRPIKELEHLCLKINIDASFMTTPYLDVIAIMEVYI